MVKIFIGGLPPDISELDLVIFVSIYAQVATVKFVRDKVTRKLKGFAFLEMPNQTEAEKAVSELNGRLFKGNTLTVNITEEKSVAKPVYPSVSKPIKNKRPRL